MAYHHGAATRPRSPPSVSRVAPVGLSAALPVELSASCHVTLLVRAPWWGLPCDQEAPQKPVAVQS